MSGQLLGAVSSDVLADPAQLSASATARGRDRLTDCEEEATCCGIGDQMIRWAGDTFRR
jgi:hypothetical protein